MNDIAVITTFPNASWEIYAKQMLQSFAQNWPQEIPLLVEVDDDCLYEDAKQILRPQDAIAPGWEKDHAEFVLRNRDKDHPTDYRKQAVRFCHKVFAIKRALNSIRAAKANNEPAARFLIWMDADVITNRPVSIEEVRACLPREGDAVAYMGRMDWDHSECGWLAFDLENGAESIIDEVCGQYLSDVLFQQAQWHDSWVWDLYIKSRPATNLTAAKPGMDIWQHSPMSAWSRHYKGPQAKADLVKQKPPKQEARAQKVIIQTKNAIPHEAIQENIRRNQELITKWITSCKPTSEEVVIVSAGPMLIAEEVRKETGKRIIAVKHALKPLKEAGIKPWASILLDPRPHVLDFVEDADRDVIWFVASQVNPKVTEKLLEKGCTVWGYHASVGAGEEALTQKQAHAIVNGGSATATRGMYVLNHLGFSNFRLYGYDLCHPDKVDLSAKDDRGQPKFLEMSVGFNHSLYPVKRCFWSDPQLIAQFEELNALIMAGNFKIKAFGDGMVPFILRAKETVDLRMVELRHKIYGTNPPDYEVLLGCSKTRRKPFLTRLRGLFPRNPLKRKTASS